MEGKLGGAVLGLVILVGVIWWNSNKADSDSWDIHDEMIELLNELPDMDTHGSLYMDWFETHHETIFEDHYQMGHAVGRRRYRRADFDGVGYMDAIFTAMIGEAASAGYEDQAQHLRDMYETVYWE